MEIHIRSILDRELTDIRDKTQQLSSLVISAIDQAMEALNNRDVELAQIVVDNDNKINALRYEIEQECLTILATQQPIAGDLRTIVATTHIAGELERIGDHATSIANVVQRMVEEDPVDTLHQLPRMAKHARRMVLRSVDAFLRRDSELATTITRREEKMDKHYNALCRATFQEMRADDYIERATYLLWAGRHLERIGDRALNIAERVIFLTTGEFVEIG